MIRRAVSSASSPPILRSLGISQRSYSTPCSPDRLGARSIRWICPGSMLILLAGRIRRARHLVPSERFSSRKLRTMAVSPERLTSSYISTKPLSTTLRGMVRLCVGLAMWLQLRLTWWQVNLDSTESICCVPWSHSRRPTRFSRPWRSVRQLLRVSNTTGWPHELPIALDTRHSFDMLFIEESHAWQRLSLKPHHFYSGRYHGQDSC